MKCRSGQVQDARPSGRISRKGWSLLLLVPEAGRGQSVLLAIVKWCSALWGVQSWLCSFTRSTRFSGIWPSCHYSSTFLCYTPAPQAGPDFSIGRTSVGPMMPSSDLTKNRIGGENRWFNKIFITKGIVEAKKQKMESKDKTI